MKSLLLLLVSASSSPWRLLLRSAAAAAVDARKAEVGPPPLPSARKDKTDPRAALPAVPEAVPARAFGVLGSTAGACCCRCCGAIILLAADVANGLLAFSFPAAAGSSIRLRRSIRPALFSFPKGLARIRSCCACPAGSCHSCGCFLFPRAVLSLAHPVCAVFAVEVFSCRDRKRRLHAQRTRGHRAAHSGSPHPLHVQQLTQTCTAPPGSHIAAQRTAQHGAAQQPSRRDCRTCGASLSVVS